jgi:hypothetical protein
LLNTLDCLLSAHHFAALDRHKHVHLEFARAYTLLCEAAEGTSDVSQLLYKLCEEAPTPPYLRSDRYKEAEEFSEAMVETLIGDEL